MPADVESLFSVRSVPWHGAGKILEKHPETIEEALMESGLGWQVQKKPVLFGHKNEEGLNVLRGTEDDSGVPQYFVNVRMDTLAPLGVVTPRYTPVQNIAAFEFLAHIFGTEMHFETAGSLMGGRRVWVMLKIPEFIEIGGDQVGQYAFISNSHDGKSAVICAMSPVRIVCMNTLIAAISSATRTYAIRHLGDMNAKMAAARDVLEITTNYYEKFKDVGDQMARTRVNMDVASRLTELLLPIEPGMGDRAVVNRREARVEILNIFENGVEQNGVNTRGNSPDTLWSWYNSATEYGDWFRKERKESGRFQRSIDDVGGLKGRAWEIAQEAL